ncbi:MAG TPA: radical SAM protein [Chloroflexi bacterium]|nr:radical SAM protein [Chloroflexota bacterium]
MSHWIKVSSGTLGVLGLVDSRLDAPPTTAYLMVGGRCRRDCAFCAQARRSSASANALSRVNWPPRDESEVLQAVEEAHAQGRIERCCLQATVSPGSIDRIRNIATRLGSRMAVSASVVATVDQVGELLDSGVQRVGLSLDAVNEESYRRVKGGDLRTSLAMIEETAHRFPGRITTHLMVGLGETEEEMVRVMALLLHWGVTPSLFAFTPIRGTAMQDESPPPLESYRRLQAARHLLVQGLCSVEDLSFSAQGRILSFGLAREELRSILARGEAFQTSGCPGCNRPYYNEPPRGPLYNYPARLSAREACRAVEEALS